MPTFLLFPAWTLLVVAALTALAGAGTGHHPGRGTVAIAAVLGVAAVVAHGVSAPLIPGLLGLAAALAVVIGGQLRGWPSLFVLLAAQPTNMAWRAPKGEVDTHQVQLVQTEGRTFLWEDLCMGDVDEREARDWAGRYGMTESRAPTAAVEWASPGRTLAWERGLDRACMHRRVEVWPPGGG